MQFGDKAFRERLARALERHQGFREETRWFDGSILLECGRSRCWLKVYRGSVIETLDQVPPFGFTFKITGPGEHWRDLVQGRRPLSDLTMPGRRNLAPGSGFAEADATAEAPLRIEGDLLEAGRIHEALHHLAECIVHSAD